MCHRLFHLQDLVSSLFSVIILIRTMIIVGILKRLLKCWCEIAIVKLPTNNKSKSLKPQICRLKWSESSFSNAKAFIVFRFRLLSVRKKLIIPYRSVSVQFFVERNFESECKCANRQRVNMRSYIYIYIYIYMCIYLKVQLEGKLTHRF